MNQETIESKRKALAESGAFDKVKNLNSIFNSGAGQVLEVLFKVGAITPDQHIQAIEALRRTKCR